MAESTTKPLVVLLIHGGPIDISDMHAHPRIGGILSAWHPGQVGMSAVADIIFGKRAPSGAWRRRGRGRGCGRLALRSRTCRPCMLNH